MCCEKRLTDPRLRIHGIHCYEGLPGLCLVMCDGDDTNFRVGVTMDLILVKQYEPIPERGTRNPFPAIFSYPLGYIIDNDLAACLENYVYSLLGSYEMDTGIIENAILRKLNGGTKQGYRVVKYGIQCVHDNIPHEFTSPRVVLSKTIDKSLYGYNPCIKSYHLSCLFINLLIHTHGKRYVEQLQRSRFALCLLDMLHRVNGLTRGIFSGPIKIFVFVFL